MAMSLMGMLAEALVAVSRIDANEIQISKANAALDAYLVSKGTYRLRRTFQHHAFQTIFVIEMHMHRSDHEIVMGMLRFSQALGQCALVMIEYVGKISDAMLAFGCDTMTRPAGSGLARGRAARYRLGCLPSRTFRTFRTSAPSRTPPMLNIPILRWGEPYESLDRDEVVHFTTGEVDVDHTASHSTDEAVTSGGHRKGQDQSSRQGRYATFDAKRQSSSTSTQSPRDY